jgi:hypothetical protein
MGFRRRNTRVAFHVSPREGPADSRRCSVPQVDRPLTGDAWFPIVGGMNGLDAIFGICPEIIR